MGRTPKLLHLMMFAACLNETEAQHCVDQYRAGWFFAGEAVNHYGGTGAVIQRAVELRTKYHVRDMLRNTGYTPK